MDIDCTPFEKLSFSKLFKSYTTDFNSLSDYYKYCPFSDDDLLKRYHHIKQTEKKGPFLKALKKYHKHLNIEKGQKANLLKLEKDNSVALVTGQQLGIYISPLYTIYKTLTTIYLSRLYEKKFNISVVPVFWMADEDHDFDEIAWAGIPGKHDFLKITLDQEPTGVPVSDEIIGTSIIELKEQVINELYETDFSDKLWSLLDAFYKPENSHAQAFAGVMNELFATEGLLIAGSNHKEVKKLVIEDLCKSIEDSRQLYDLIEKQSTKIEADFHRQVLNNESNLFFLNEGRREKISKENDNWVTDSKEWTKDELIDMIHDSPQQFSPNVFLRPIIQDRLLPTLGYVAGPGEIAYYGQMKLYYQGFDMQMPPIIPRLSITLFESGITRIMEKLPFEFHEYNDRIEDLEKEFVEHSNSNDIEAVFDNWINQLERSTDEPRKIISEIDPSLDGMVGKTLAGFENELNKLKGRVYRSVKEQEETQIRRIEKIKVNLFPDGGLQERAVSPIYFMNKYGTDIWNRILDHLMEVNPDLKEHLKIDL